MLPGRHFGKIFQGQRHQKIFPVLLSKSIGELRPRIKELAAWDFHMLNS